MKKLLLTSAGLTTENIKKEFLKRLDKPVGENKLLIISYNRYEESLDSAKAPILEAGVKEENVKIIDISKDEKVDSFDNFDIVYVLGGNTFSILDKIRKIGLDKLIIKFIKSGKLYIGLSAGSMIVGPNISISETYSEKDKNHVGLKDVRGFRLIDVELFPHFTEDKKGLIEGFQKKVSYKILGLTDEQALLVIGEKIKII